MPGNFKRRNNSHTWCQRREDVKHRLTPPKLHCFLFHPDCASECCPVSPLFPGSTSDLPGHFLQVAGVCSTLSQQAFNACFPRLSFKMLLSCFWHPEMCNWHCKQCGKKSIRTSQSETLTTETLQGMESALKCKRFQTWEFL